MFGAELIHSKVEMLGLSNDQGHVLPKRQDIVCSMLQLYNAANAVITV